MKKNSTRRRFLSRLSGPAVSILLHGAAIYLLFHLVAFKSADAPRELETEYAQQEQLHLDELFEAPPVEPLDPATLVTADDVPPISADVQRDLAVASATVLEPEMEALSVLPSESPLRLRALGADAASLTALTDRYGERASRNGLLGSYFNRIDFTGETQMRIDETLNKQWELESPWPGRIRSERFSVIWTGRIVPRQSGRYAFYLQSDDGARLWINGQVMLDQFTEHARQEDVVEMDLLAGLSYDIKYAFCDVFQHAISRLEWSCADAGIPRQLVPTDCMWADGASTRELLAWNDDPRHGYPQRDRVRNPAVLEGVAYSHLVDYRALDEAALVRLDLQNLVEDYRRFARTGRLPDEFARPSGLRAAAPREAEAPDRREVRIEIL